MHHVISVLKLNTRLFLNCLDGVSNDMAWTRPNERTNSIGFIALHLVDARYYIADYLDIDLLNPYKEVFANVKRIEDLHRDQYPDIEELRTQWVTVAEALNQELPHVKKGQLQAESPFQFPVEDRSVYGGLQFLIQHESYHIGQMALLRKYAGLPAMKYT